MMSRLREIVFDTETTGFDAKGDDRITELGCIELIDHLPTGKSFHAYLDPQREVPDKVVEITGLTTEFLRGKPLFKERAQEFLDFVGDDRLVAHNADFDRGFINAELERNGFAPLPKSQFLDTLRMAREKFPGSPATLDALCKRFDVSLAIRDKHGAITDSILLAQVYLELLGGRARKLEIFDDAFDSGADQSALKRESGFVREAPLPSGLTEEEKTAHAAFVANTLSGGMWERYLK